MVWGISVGAQNWGVPLLNHNSTIHKKMSGFAYICARSYISFNLGGRDCVFTQVCLFCPELGFSLKWETLFSLCLS